MIKPRYTLDEIARLGDAAYGREAAPRVGAGDMGRFVDGRGQRGVRDRRRAVLADGSETTFPVHRAVVDWGGARRKVNVHVADSVSLLGMAMLAGHELRMEVIPDGLCRSRLLRSAPHRFVRSTDPFSTSRSCPFRRSS